MENKTFVVIGGSSGIGRAVVDRLSERNYQVIVGSRSAKDVQFESNVTPFRWDVTEAFPNDVDLPGTIQGLVYCPGTINLASLNRLTVGDFENDHRVNMLGAVRSVKTFLPALKKSSAGASIVFFSTVAVGTGMPFHTSIASTKGAVEGFTRALAAELAPRVRVNAIAPSLTDTPLAQQLLSTDAKREASEARHPLKRVGSPNDIAALAVFLVDDTASWITGQILRVDGGMSTLRTFN